MIAKTPGRKLETLAIDAGNVLVCRRRLAREARLRRELRNCGVQLTPTVCLQEVTGEHKSPSGMDTFARRLRTLSGLTPYEYVVRSWTSEPDRFIGTSVWGERNIRPQGVATCKA